MLMNDPLGDMLTRIRNAQMRKRPNVTTPASRCARRVLDVLQSEGYIRGYSETRVQRQGRVRDRAEIFRRPAGDPRDRARLEAGPPRLFLGARTFRASPTGSASRSCRRRRASCRTTRRATRMSAAKCSAASSDAAEIEERIERCRELARSRWRCRRASPRTSTGQTVTAKGPKGELAVALVDKVGVEMTDGGIAVAPRDESKEARAMWGMSRTLVQNIVTGVTKGFEERLEINGVGYRAQVQGKNLSLALGYSHDVNYPIPEGIQIADAEADRDRRLRHRQAEGRPGRRRDPPLAAAGALQGQGREICRASSSSARKARRSNG